jgi:DUF4097 and DUF4098 domain-containing protein YvlB
VKITTFFQAVSLARFRSDKSALDTKRLSAVVVLLMGLPVATLVCAPAVLAQDTPVRLRPLKATRLTADSTGTIPARDGQCLHLTTDLGNIEIHTQNSGKIDYRVHLEADASQKNARQLLKNFTLHAGTAPEGVFMNGQTGRESSGRLWVTLEVDIPQNYSLDVATGGGNVETDDVNGHISLSTAGGDIVAGNIGGSARLETNGGHITVKNVQGELIAGTGGGHITAAIITGDAFLHTSGGHIRVSSVGGAAHLVTGGGNVTLEHSGGELVAETSGGQIEVGDATGLVRAKTGGGGIRLARISGPSELKTVGGSIYLTQVDSAVKASTDAGGITAWFVGPPKRPGPCELDSSAGDIVVHLPRQLPVTIDALVEMADEHRVIVDPAFPLKLSYGDSANGLRTIRAEGALNGGGELLRLRAVEGNIRVVLSDADKQIQLYNQQMEQLGQQLRVLQLQLRSLLSSQAAPAGTSRH